MAISVDWPTKAITVPQADLTFISGTLYELDTDWFRLQLKALEDDSDGIVFIDTHRHNTEVTVAGTTFARTVEIINGYTVEFTPDAQYSVRLVGSNNNIFDVGNGILVQNQVQVIPTNSAGLIVGAGAAPGDVWDVTLEGAYSAKQLVRLMLAALTGKASGAATTTMKFRDLADAKDRITATVDEDGNRSAVTLDPD